jgi:hypothetical protein
MRAFRFGAAATPPARLRLPWHISRITLVDGCGFRLKLVSHFDQQPPVLSASRRFGKLATVPGALAEMFGVIPHDAVKLI